MPTRNCLKHSVKSRLYEWVDTTYIQRKPTHSRLRHRKNYLCRTQRSENMKLIPKKILVRAPNWLGDLVMSLAFFYKLREAFPDAVIEAVVKAEIADLLDLVPSVSRIHLFSKKDYRGVRGLYRFASRFSDIDLYFSLPDSFSSALMGVFARAKRRIGFRGDLRGALLTDALRKPKHLHRSEEYAMLLSPFLAEPTTALSARLTPPPDALLAEFAARPKIVLNLNSESPSKVVPLQKGVEIAEALLRCVPDAMLVLTGSPKERRYAETFATMLSAPSQVANLAGKTTVKTLASALAAAHIVISTDSGTAHLANAVGTPTLVLYGAGDERNTSPYHRENSFGFRVKGLDCAPCVSTICKFGEPKCLAQMPAADIAQKVAETLRALGVAAKLF